MAEEEGCESLGLGIEYGDPTYQSYWFKNDTIIAKWQAIIAGIRTIYSGNLTMQVQSWAYRGINSDPNEFIDRIKNATYLGDLDYIQFAEWSGDLVLGEPYTALDVAKGWFTNHEHNYMADLSEIYELWNVSIMLNMGFPNSYNGILAPWNQYAGDYRKDDSQYLAWQGTLWAFQPQEWIRGLDFEEYDKWYYSIYGQCGDSSYNDASFGGSIMFVQETQTRINNTLALWIFLANPTNFNETITPTIEWQPFSMLFLCGMVGLFGLFLGPSYGIYKARHGSKIEAFILTVIITSIGFALTVAWLWGR
jgi:hypothetical protein